MSNHLYMFDAHDSNYMNQMMFVLLLLDLATNVQWYAAGDGRYVFMAE